jgi:predicted RNase H-like nuclease
MRAVLGIDAAWTLKQPSGVALATQIEVGMPWRLVALESSYQRFHTLAGHGLAAELRPSGTRPAAAELLASSQKLCGLPVEVVAIDMPLAHQPITGRRESDNAVSSAYGARKCGTHTPSGTRPGRISDELKEEFGQARYPLQTDSIATPGLIEVYPHPALVELANAPERLPYKVSKVRSYWPSSDATERRERLFEVWAGMVDLLDKQITGVAEKLPLLPLASDARLAELKEFEDMLDAIVCAWVAICALEDNAKPFGDRNSAIWIPSGRTFQ